MNSLLILFAVIILTCVFLNNASYRIGMPVLLGFILLGIIFGNNGLIPIPQMIEDKSSIGQISTFALIFIMFYGGFGTSWQTARPVAIPAAILSSAGVIVTAGVVTLMCHFLLGWGWLEALLLGSIVSSTDAASVFSILRSRHLGLKNNIGPLLEIESGSNDPCSYMMTIIAISLIKGNAGVGSTFLIFLSQMGFGLVFGVCIAAFAVFAIRRISFATSGFDSLFIMSIAIISYALPSVVGGNGYLSAYIVGIVLGNQTFEGKRKMVNFFDGITSLMQVLLFFLLGMLATPSALGSSIVPALIISLILLFLARPLAVALSLTPFRFNFVSQLLVSFCGLRGASSIVFAILATTAGLTLEHDVFSVVFCIVMLSIAFQGTLLPIVSKLLNMLDRNVDINKTFSDFSADCDLQFSHIEVGAGTHWDGKAIKDIGLPSDMLFCMIFHKDGKEEVPTGSTVLQAGDTVIVCSKEYRGSHRLKILQHTMSNHSRYDGVAVKDLPYNASGQLLLIRRGDQSLIPNGNTILRSGDVLFVNQR